MAEANPGPHGPPEVRHQSHRDNDEAHLDDGAVWPTSFALNELTATEAARIGALVEQAVS